LVLCGVAVCMVRQKFGPTEGDRLRNLLVQQTGTRILAGPGSNLGQWCDSIQMPAVYEIPARWKGSYVLGWALMQVRGRMRAELEEAEGTLC
jgi:predicted NAD-dependent protein-ADP-ribosyltransferase YbiA (DUF1768 family)